MKTEDPIFIVVDLFCGAGGTTTGFDMAGGVAKVIACVNHDPKAIKSHWLNHPDVKHFEEDIRTLDLTELIALVAYCRNKYPNAYLILWASLECTNFSKAKGGQPRDADSRTLADHLDRYIVALNPDYVQIENVVEFMSWGPLDANGKPVSRKNGQDWLRWRSLICSHGYRDEWREMNSANYGAYTSRNRLFGVFAKEGLPIAWPEPTHAKVPQKRRNEILADKIKNKPSLQKIQRNLFDMYGGKLPWKAVKEVLNFEDEGESIFNRPKPLSDKTLERIYAGLIKYVANGDTAFISKYYSGKPSGKNIPVSGPAGTVTCIDGQALVNASFLMQSNGGLPSAKVYSPELPSRVITTSDNQALVQTEFLLKYNSMSKKGVHVPPSVDEPAPVVSCQGRLGLVQPQFITQYFGKSLTTDISGPLNTITTKDRAALVQPQYLVNYNHSSKVNGINEPAPTLVTKDKLALVEPQYFIDKHFGTAQNQSIEQPAGTIMPNDKHRLIEVDHLDDRVQVNCNCGNSWISAEAAYQREPCSKCGGYEGSVTHEDSFLMPTNYDNGPKSLEEPCPTITANRKHHYIVNPSHGGHSTSIEAPCPVIVARQDKAPLYVVQAEAGNVAVEVYADDSEAMIRIKQFMAVYGLVDIKMRMLRVSELLKIQGFPEGYKLEGNQADQKKFIGNSVVPHVVKAWTMAMASRLFDNDKRNVA